MIKNIAEINANVAYHGAENFYDNFHNYKWPIELFNESAKVVDYTFKSEDENKHVFTIPQSMMKPVFGRCDIRVKIEDYPKGLIAFRSKINTLSYGLLFSGQYVEKRCVIIHELLRALLPNNNNDYNDYFFIDEHNKEYVFSFPLLLDFFTNGNGFEMPKYHITEIEIDFNSNILKKCNVSSMLHITFCDGTFIPKITNPDFLFYKKMRLYDVGSIFFDVGDITTQKFCLPLYFKRHPSSGLFLSFIDRKSNTVIRNYDFVSNVSLVIDNSPNFTYNFTTNQIFGNCKKFLSFEKQDQKLKTFKNVEHSRSTTMKRTMFPVEVWSNIIEVLFCVVDIKNLTSTCKCLYDLRKTSVIKNYLNRIRLPGWFCIPFNNDGEYETSPKGYTINLSRIFEITLLFTFSGKSPTFQKLVGKRLSLIVVNSYSNICLFQNHMYALRYSK